VYVKCVGRRLAIGKIYFEEYHLLGYNAVWFVESQLTFRRNPEGGGDVFLRNVC
jgi:hypothetical protein